MWQTSADTYIDTIAVRVGPVCGYTDAQHGGEVSW